MYKRQVQDKLNENAVISLMLKNPESLTESVKQLQKMNQDLQKQIEAFSKSNLKGFKKTLMNQVEHHDEIGFIFQQTELSGDEMKKVAFEIKGELQKFVLILTSIKNKKPLITLMISDDLVKAHKWNAGQIIRQLAKEIKGGGGGQPFFATAGGSYVDGLSNIKRKAINIFF